MNIILLLSFFLLLSNPIAIHTTGKRVVVCDLITQQNILIATQLALANTCHYVKSRISAVGMALGYGVRSIISLKDPTKLQQQLFDELQGAPVQSIDTAYYQGSALPPLFSAYLASRLSGQETLTRAISHLDAGTSREKNLFKAATELFVTPDQMVQTLSPAPTVIALFKKLKEQSPDIELILAANFTSAAVLQAAPSFRALFPYLSGTFCSGEGGILKSSPDFYTQLCERFPHIRPGESVFIETEEPHVAAARRAGFTALAWKDPIDSTEVIQQLRECGITIS